MLNQEQLRHLAQLAKLELSDEELAGLQKDLNSILAYVEQVSQLELSEIKSPYPEHLSRLPLREDIPQVKDIKTIKKIIENFPCQEGAYLKVPKVIEK